LIPTIHSLISEFGLFHSQNTVYVSTSLAALCQQGIPNSIITIIKNNEVDIQTLRLYLPFYDAVIVGPGPGSPENPQDIGLVKDLWELQDKDLLPIFGVCLGLQSLAIEHGAALKRLTVVKHGQISPIIHVSTDIFENVGTTSAVRYHSLHVELKSGGVIEELGWTNDAENGRVVMAIRHRSRPFWGVQYHPESICTDQGGLDVLCNFWRLSREWCLRTGRRTLFWPSDLACKFGRLWPYACSIPAITSNTKSLTAHSVKLQRSDLSVIDVCEALGVSSEPSDFVLLESASRPGRFSVIASLSSSSPRIQYRIGNTYVEVRKCGQSSHENLGTLDIWSWLAEFMKNRGVINGDPEIPFWGGLIGYLSYELGVDALNVSLKREAKECSDRPHPDVNLVFVERSIVVDSKTGSTVVQSIVPRDQCWVNTMVNLLEDLRPGPPSESRLSSEKPVVRLPDKARYISRIHQAKQHLAAGDSYELCLTAQTRVSVPSSGASKSMSSSWERYKQLRKLNPAPHSAYLRLHPSTLLASSPERFLSYSRRPGTVCQLRPIKGTVRKGPQITRPVAEKLLIGSPKEVAENLMIVDLIRHDLHGFVGQDVRVKQFCSVEEYETVWQLVSVIEGKLSDDTAPEVEGLGWEVLQRSLPPGMHTLYPSLMPVLISDR
jgi:para-aminobenzoate synthetase